MIFAVKLNTISKFTKIWYLYIKQVDTKGKGTLDYGEFVAVSLHLQKVANDEHLRKAFSYFDKDGNGYILPKELCDALKEDGGDDCVDVANDIFQEVDTDKVSDQVSNLLPFYAWYGLILQKINHLLQDHMESVTLNLFLRYLFGSKPFEITVFQIGNGNTLCKRFLKPAKDRFVALNTFCFVFFRLCLLC